MRPAPLVPRIASVALAATALTLGTTTVAQAAELTLRGDLSYRSVAVARLANCAATDYFEHSHVGSRITSCDGAGSDPHWDHGQVSTGVDVSIDAFRVGYANGACPSPERGTDYVKCFYVGGRHAGDPVMTVSTGDHDSTGMSIYVHWYYQ